MLILFQQLKKFLFITFVCRLVRRGKLFFIFLEFSKHAYNKKRVIPIAIGITLYQNKKNKFFTGI